MYLILGRMLAIPVRSTTLKLDHKLRENAKDADTIMPIEIKPSLSSTHGNQGTITRRFGTKRAEQ